MLQGIRVLDLSEDRAGAYATHLLAGLGADVITVEPPGRGCALRGYDGKSPHAAAPEADPRHLFLNAGKRSITLDVMRPDARPLLDRLLAGADVLVEDLPATVLERAGLSEALLIGRFPRLVVASVTPFGRAGPDADMAATELTVQARAGWVYVIGDPDRPPLRCGSDVAAALAGVNAAVHCLAALWQRADTGAGRHVDVSQLETLCRMLGVTGLYVTWTHDRDIRVRRGNRAPAPQRNPVPRVYPTTMLPCADGYLAIAAQTAQQWQSLCVLLDRPDLVTDPRFATVDARGVNADELDAILVQALAGRTRRELFRRAGELHLPVGMALSIAELLEDPHLVERHVFVTVEHPIAGPLPLPRLPFEMAGGGLPPPRRAPLLGEHNEAVYAGELGLSREDLARLRAVGAI